MGYRAQTGFANVPVGSFEFNALIVFPLGTMLVSIKEDFEKIARYETQQNERAFLWLLD